MSLLKQMQIFGVLTIIMSVANVIVVWPECEVAVQQQRINFTGFFNETGNVTRNREFGNNWKSSELRLNPFQICYWVTINFLIYGGSSFGLSFAAFNLIFIFGFMSSEKFAYHVILFMVNFWFIFLVLRALEQASHMDKEEEDDVLSVIYVTFQLITYEEAAQQQLTYYKGVFKGIKNSTRYTDQNVRDDEKLLLSQAKELSNFEILLRACNIVTCTLQLIYNVKKGFGEASRWEKEQGDNISMIELSSMSALEARLRLAGLD
ncbi:unnamed protein product [Orchesella dallaii]|uniref:Uncharacterized protein n=1 Tax=Orchesella dallaii TaxID=48710 RepID=A0ABP1RGG8_9HEXA